MTEVQLLATPPQDRISEQVQSSIEQNAPIGRSRRSLITFVPDRPGHDLRYSIDAAEARRELGWQPRMELERGLERTVRWSLENRSWWEPLRQNLYRASSPA